MTKKQKVILHAKPFYAFFAFIFEKFDISIKESFGHNS